MLIVIAEATMTEQQKASFLALARPMIEASRREPGCLAYWYAFDALEPLRLRVNEIWADRAALDFHFTTGHLRHFRRELAALKPGDLKITVRELGAETKLPS